MSAHLAQTGAVELGGRDGIVVVFSDEIDPATLVAGMLLVVSKDGHRMPPERALLSPAKWGQTRTVLLIGNFTEDGREPSDVVIVGRLYTRGGVALRGLSSSVGAFDSPDRVVLAQRMQGDGRRCRGARQIVRTYWTDRLGGEEDPHPDAIRVWLRDGTELTPAGIDRTLAQENPDRGDNVVDLCLSEEIGAERLRIEAGVFQDAAGHPTALIDVSIEGPPVVRR